MKVEKRWLPCSELRAVKNEDGTQKIGGYAARFNALSQVLWNFREKIKEGAFGTSIKENDVRALWSHNSDLVLGRTGNDTLSLKEDEKGLEFELELPDTTLGRDAFTSIERGDVDGMSFGFIVRKEEWERSEDNEPHIRTLVDIDLIEVSPTAFPAYEQTNVTTRSSEIIMKDQETTWAFEDKEKDERKMKKKLAQLEVLELELDLEAADVADITSNEVHSFPTKQSNINKKE